MSELMEKQTAVVAEDCARVAAEGAFAAAKSAAAAERVEGRLVRLTADNLQEITDKAGDFVHEQSLTVRVANVLEAVKQCFPNVLVPEGGGSVTGDSRTAISEGGYQVAFHKLAQLFQDEGRP